jgi:hypothetical protein
MDPVKYQKLLEFLHMQKQVEEEERKKIKEEIQREIEGDIKNKDPQKADFINYLKQNYGFEGFHHYTNFNNFIKIMELGLLLSRTEAEKYGFYDAAEKGVISRTQRIRSGVLDCVRFYYKENTPTTYRNEGIKVDNKEPHMSIPVLLLFSEEIIYYKDVYFMDGCGGSKYTRGTEDVETAKSFDWKTVFSRGEIFGDKGTREEITRKRNAEFLFYKGIDTKYLKKIVFRCPADLKHAEAVFGENELFNVNSLKFHNRNNYLSDYKFEHKGDCVEVELTFIKGFDNNYMHELVVIYDDCQEHIDICKAAENIRHHLYFGYKKRFDYILQRNKIPDKIEYYMNGHLSAIWKGNEK